MLQTGYDKWSSVPPEDRELWFRQFAQEYTWESGLTETVRQAFSRKAQTVYTKQIYEWKQVWLDNRKPRLLSGTVWTQLIQHWEKEETIEKSLQNSANRKSDHGGKGIYVHNLGACSMSSKEDQLIQENDGNPVDHLVVMKEAYTNKKTGEIQDPVIREVIEMVESQKEAFLASQPLSDDDSTGASNNMSRLQINELVEKGRLVGLARRASSSQVPYADPLILEQLQNKDQRIGALEEQNATILAELADQKKTNLEILQKLDRLLPDQ
ncbi:Uncharacterized protein Rs2_47736 [Raphanus sativus]|nr:Uncharacterized protein Rs2_47736 [Raphanus sativus]